MDSLLVSICVPVYGVEKYIERCARSLFEQSYENIEFVFVNDCTKDDSIDVLKRVLLEYPARAKNTKIIDHERNQGLGAARNTAVKNASGDFLMWVDSDDYVDKTVVEKCILKQNATDADIVTVGAIRLTPKCNIPMTDKKYSSVKAHLSAVIERNAETHIWGRLIRRSLYVNNDIGVLPGANMGEDYQVLPRLLFFSKKTEFVEESLYYYDCMNENSYSNQYSIAKNEQSWMSFDVIKRFFNDKDEYKKSIAVAELSVIVSHFIMSEKEHLDYYYENARKRVPSISSQYWKYIPLVRRLVLYVYKSRFAMNVYIKTSRFIRQACLYMRFRKAAE